MYVLCFSLPFFSLEETKDFPIQGLLLGFVVGSIGISLTNGGIGTFPLLIAMVVIFFIGDKNPNAQAIGNAIGMLIWVSQTLMMVLLGLLSLILLPKNYTKENVEAAKN
jgi:glycosyltransferase 2 family protein